MQSFPLIILSRKMKENIDFSFVNPMLHKQYCENFGRPAKEPEMMSKLLLLKKLYDQSSHKIQESTYYRRYSGRNVKGNDTAGFG